MSPCMYTLLIPPYPTPIQAEPALAGRYEPLLVVLLAMVPFRACPREVVLAADMP